MELWEILVPTIRNNGNPFRLRYHRIFDNKVREITGGLTINKPSRGQWVSPSGALYDERMIPVRIACNQLQIQQIADFAARHYEQLAIMFYKISEDVHIIHYDPDKKFQRKKTST